VVIGEGIRKLFPGSRVAAELDDRFLGEEFENWLRWSTADIDWLLPESQVAENALDDFFFIDEGDDPHLILTIWTKQRICFPDFLDELAPLSGGTAPRCEAGYLDSAEEKWNKGQVRMIMVEGIIVPGVTP